MGLLLKTSVGAVFKELSSNLALILLVILISCKTSESGLQNIVEDTPDSTENYIHTCEAFFLEYVEAAGNFTHCQLLYAKPFRICTKCFRPYAIMKSLYNDLTTDPKLHDCMIKYMKADRVQIIPTVQTNADDLWQNSACKSCISHLSVDEKTKKVNFSVPEDIGKFMMLYENTTKCLGKNITLKSFELPETFHKEDNVSIYCKLCNHSYHHLNDHYNSLASDAAGDVCMDVVDMMNYTRVSWSDDLNCSHRTGDAVSVVIITLVVAISPLFFYLPLRYTSEEKIKKVLKQKRLGASYEGILSSTSASFAAGDGSNGAPSTRLPPIGSR